MRRQGAVTHTWHVVCIKRKAQLLELFCVTCACILSGSRQGLPLFWQAWLAGQADGYLAVPSAAVTNMDVRVCVGVAKSKQRVVCTIMHRHT